MRRYTALTGALVECSQCGAAVTNLPAHETWHAMTPDVAECALRARGPFAGEPEAPAANHA